MRETVVIFQRPYRRSLIAGTSIWFLTNFWSSAVLFFFTYYVMQERGWSPELAGKVMPLAALIGIGGYLLSGPLLDLIGRRVTTGLYFSLGGLSAVICFQAETTLVITLTYILVMAANAVWAISATITSEIFPTAIRATGNAVVNNLLGRTGMVIAPALVGILSKSMGSVGNAVAVLAVFNFLCLPIILFSLRETKGQVLEDISA
jgi:putative MFS transporter